MNLIYHSECHSHFCFMKEISLRVVKHKWASSNLKLPSCDSLFCNFGEDFLSSISSFLQSYNFVQSCNIIIIILEKLLRRLLCFILHVPTTYRWSFRSAITMSLLGKSSSIPIASLMSLNSLSYVTDPEKGIPTSLSLLPFSNLCPVE